MAPRPDAPEREPLVLAWLERELAGVDLAALAWRRRERGWLGSLPHHVVWVGHSARAWRGLEREVAVLELARGRLGARVPAVRLVDRELRAVICERKAGVSGPAIEARIFGVEADARPPTAVRLSPACPLTPWGRTFARELGEVLARLHGAVSVREARDLGFAARRRDWDAVARALAGPAALPELESALENARAWDERRARTSDPSFVHGDPHLGNVVCGANGELIGLIDFGDAALADRHEDLCFVHSQGLEFAARVLDAYARESGVRLDAEVVARLHVCSALEHFAWVDASAPRFAGIVDWARVAVERLAPEWR